MKDNVQFINLVISFIYKVQHSTAQHSFDRPHVPHWSNCLLNERNQRLLSRSSLVGLAKPDFRGGRSNYCFAGWIRRVPALRGRVAVTENTVLDARD